jgi:hypothetical protein
MNENRGKTGLLEVDRLRAGRIHVRGGGAEEGGLAETGSGSAKYFC